MQAHTWALVKALGFVKSVPLLCLVLKWWVDQSTRPKDEMDAPFTVSCESLIQS